MSRPQRRRNREKNEDENRKWFPLEIDVIQMLKLTTNTIIVFGNAAYADQNVITCRFFQCCNMFIRRNKLDKIFDFLIISRFELLWSDFTTH